MNLLCRFQELLHRIKVDGGIMTTFLMLRLLVAMILIAFGFLLHFLGELLENKPWRESAARDFQCGPKSHSLASPRA